MVLVDNVESTCPFNLKSYPSSTPISTASSKVFPFVHMKTLPSIKEILKHFLSRDEIERRFFLSPGTYRTYFIFMDFPESNL